MAKILRFKKEFEDAKIHLRTRGFYMDKKTFTQAGAQMLIKEYGDRYAHNFEEVEETPAEDPNVDQAPQLNAKERAKLARNAESLEVLDALAQGEEAKTVLSAIEKRREELIAAQD